MTIVKKNIRVEYVFTAAKASGLLLELGWLVFGAKGVSLWELEGLIVEPRWLKVGAKGV